MREKFAEGRINLDQATALANATEKVGPDTVEADPDLLESADQMLLASIPRPTRLVLARSP